MSRHDDVFTHRNAEFAQLVYAAPTPPAPCPPSSSTPTCRYYHACADPTDSKCAFYREHNDYIEGDAEKLQGVRIYTLFT